MKANFAIVMLICFLAGCTSNRAYNPGSAALDPATKYQAPARAAKISSPEKPAVTVGPLVMDNESLLAFIREKKLPSMDSLAPEGARARESVAKQRIIPRLYFNSSINYPVFAYESPYRDDIEDALYLYFSIAWNVNIFTYFRDVKRAEYETKLADMQADLSGREFSVKCVDLYYKILMMDRARSYAERNMQVKRKLLNLARVSSVSGMESPEEPDSLEQEIILADIGVLESEGARNDQLAELKTMLELPLEFLVELKSPRNAQWSMPSLETCQAKAKDYNATTAPTTFALSLLDEAESAIKLERWTDFNIYVSTPQARLFNKDSSSNWERDFYAGFNWAIPLYDGGEINLRLKQLSLERRRLSLQHDQGLRELKRIVDLLYRQCQLLDKKIAAQEQVVDRHEKRLRGATAAQRAGSGTPMDALRAQISLEEQQTRLETWRLERAMASFKLRMLMGEESL